MGFVTNEFLSSSGICHYCYDEKKSVHFDPILWALHILLEHPNTVQAIRLKERSMKK